MQSGVVVPIVAVAIVGWSPAAAQTPPAAAPPTAGLTASRPHVGWVSLRVTGAPGATAAIVENGGAGPEPIATVTVGPAGTIGLDRAAPWRCDRARPNAS